MWYNIFNMPTRETPLIEGETYHIFNRGMSKQNIFFSQQDYLRILLMILYGQSSVSILNTGRHVESYVKHQVFNIEQKQLEEIQKNRFVSLKSFCIMPNHFHLLVEQLEENGISKYMQKIQNSYAKYFNTKYQKSGHVLQGPFKSVHIEDNTQLLHTSAYIHRNPIEIKKWKKNYTLYPYSSLQDYVGKNRWNNLLEQNIILDQFNSKDDYKKFINTSAAKNHESELEIKML